MGLIRHKLRVFIRNNFRPVNPVQARLWNTRLKRAYMFFAWNCAIIWVYSVFMRKSDPTEEPLALYHAKRMGIDKTEIIRVSPQGVVRVSATEELKNYEKKLADLAAPETPKE